MGLNPTSEKCLLIDLFVLRRGHELRELTEIVWIPSSQNPADVMADANFKDALRSLVQTSSVLVDAKIWIERQLEKLQKRKTRLAPQLHSSAKADICAPCFPVT